LHCNTLQYTATAHYKFSEHYGSGSTCTAIKCNSMLQILRKLGITARYVDARAQLNRVCKANDARDRLQHTATCCNTMQQQAATHCGNEWCVEDTSVVCHTATYYNTLQQQIATHCSSTLQQRTSATHCSNALQQRTAAKKNGLRKVGVMTIERVQLGCVCSSVCSTVCSTVLQCMIHCVLRCLCVCAVERI